MKDRIRQLMDSEGLSPAKLAGRLGVLPSNISHLLSGRNKPGFDLIATILTNFPDINPYWLILGRGTAYADVVESPLERLKQKVVDTNVITDKAISSPIHATEQTIALMDVKSNSGDTNVEELGKERSGETLAGTSRDNLSAPIATGSGDGSPNHKPQPIETEQIAQEMAEGVIILFSDGRFKQYTAK